MIKLIKDYCYYTGKYRVAAHSMYNLKYNIPKYISVVFHNRSNYDYHFVLKELQSVS